MPVESLSLAVILAAVGGGAFGAAVGGLPAYSLAGLAIAIGEAITAGGVRFGTGGAIESSGFTNTVGLGPALGPHVAFAGGVAAAAYCARRGEIDSSFEYHQAKEITTPLGSDPRTLAVGGVFGALGMVILGVVGELGLPVDGIALSIVLTAILHRIAFGYPLVGHLGRDILDMTPYEKGQRRGDMGAEMVQADGGRYVVEPFMPAHFRWENVLGLGAVVGLASGYLALATGSVFLPFGLAAASLLFLSLDLADVPMTHHMALPAGIVAASVGAADPAVAILAGGVFGGIGAGVGELAQRILYAHGDTHLDPPAASMVVTSLLITGLATAGLLDAGVIPYPVL